MHHLTGFSLEAKYEQESGTVLLSGLQALLRLALDQRRADQRRGLNTAMLVSGYRGSPLGELDITFQEHQKLLDQHHIVFMGAVNEELGATAIYGSQFANLLPDPKYDGVLGLWYGKSPGVDRSGDVFKHANFAGVGKQGGVLALAGDDPAAKSSTLPSDSSVELYSAHMPVLYPGDVQEVIDLGRYGFELSRYSGLWAGFKIVTNVADGFYTAEVSPDRITIHDPGFTYLGKPWKHHQETTLLAPASIKIERELFEGRIEAARAFVAANKLNQITVNPAQAWLGIVAAGKTYFDVRQALLELGLDDNALLSCGIRLLKISVLYPLDPGVVIDFARGLEEIVVIEEKDSFIELFIRDILYQQTERPRVVGKRDETGTILTKYHGELDADEITPILAKRLQQRIAMPSIANRLAQLNAPRGSLTIPLQSRSAYFCSGCPHNRSTVVPEGSLSGAGIGCHTMVMMMDDRIPIGITQMGGEGVNWVGMSPFTGVKHIFQNLGDGTLFHSGLLAIRQAVAANTNITYKILYNDAVAMTGGQTPDGGMTVPEVTRELQSEGVKKILVLTNHTEKYTRATHWGPGVELWDRDRLEEAQERLRQIPGVTVLIYDQECAAELRRKRKRGLIPDPSLAVFINESVCEGCGDCGVKSNCLSVHPVETEFGRKTQIHQSSCNKDYSCLDGNCPAFITVAPKTGVKKVARLYHVDVDLPDPVRKIGDESNIYLMGIGGTGVVTTNQILGTAALLDDKYIRGLDQTGLSQKGGPVVSHLKITNREQDVSNKLGVGEADCYLVFDVLTGTMPQHLSHARPDRTVAIVSTSEVPTGAMVHSSKVNFPVMPSLLNAIEDCTRREDNVYLDAIHLAEALFNSHMAANMIVVGAAYQAGLLPMSAESIEEAIQLNGTAVEMNRQAFKVGRRVVVDPAWAKSINKTRAGELTIQPIITNDARRLIDSVDAPAGSELLRLLEIRVPDLIAYQNVGYAQQYVEFVRKVYAIERQNVSSETRLSESVARYLYKLMAFKDEYEVARLSLDREVDKALADQFGTDAAVQFNLYPPLLKAIGLKHKIKLGRWFIPVFRLLRAMRVLRFTPFDIFGYDQIRRIERALIHDYRDLIDQASVGLNVGNYERAVLLANLPDMIRGYDTVKLANVADFRREVAKLGFGKPSAKVGQSVPVKVGAGD